MNKSKLVILKDWKGKLIFTDEQPTTFNMMMATETKDGR